MTDKINESANQKVENITSAELVNSINDVASFRHKDQFYGLVSYLTSNLQNTVSTREFYYNQLANYRHNYIVNGIYDIIAGDVFVDNGSTDFITVAVQKDPVVEKEIRKLFERLNVSNFLVSILPEILHYGSYSIRPITKEKRGVIDLVDDLDPRQVIPITDSKNIPLMFFISNILNNRPDQTNLMGQNTTQLTPSYQNKTTVEYKDITEVLHFSIDLSFSKMVIPEKMMKQVKGKAPDLQKKLIPSVMKIKTSQSFIWPAIDKLKEVLLLDKLSVYRDIGSILTPNIIGIPVPDVYDPSQLIEIVKKYDELLNSSVVKVNNTQNMEITLQELASVKVVPIVGDRTTPTAIDVGRSQPISSNDALEASIARLLNSLGVPKELFDGTSDSKSNMKTNIRYAKKIKRIQKNIIKTLKLLCLLHISIKYPEKIIYAADINIQLKNNTNIDELENMESQDLIVSSISSIKGLLGDLELMVEKSSYEIDVDKVVENVMDSFSSLGSKYHNIFVKREVKPESSVFTNEKEQSFPSDLGLVQEQPMSPTEILQQQASNSEDPSPEDAQEVKELPKESPNVKS